MTNEKRLIDANALETRMCKQADMYGTDHLFIDVIVYEIGNAPIVDAVEVVHGRWEDEYGGKYANPRYRCSACKAKALYKFERDVLDNWKEKQALTPICPNCGAKMDGGNEDV